MKTSVFMEILWGTLKHYIFEEVASADESNYMLMERKERTFLALYGSLGKDEQTAADNRMDFLLSQTRADYAKKLKKTGGTKSIIVEQHNVRMRTFNTHNPYYR